MFSLSIILDFQCPIRIFKLIQTVGLQSLWMCLKFFNRKFEMDTDAQIEAENHNLCEYLNQALLVWKYISITRCRMVGIFIAQILEDSAITITKDSSVSKI